MKTHRNRTGETGRSFAGAAVPAALMSMAMLAITGCAGTHVGDDWQCPMAQGEICASVSAADPAVPAGAERADSPLPAGEIPLYRPRGQSDWPPRQGKTKTLQLMSEKECGKGFGLLLPFAWLGSGCSLPDSHASVDSCFICRGRARGGDCIAIRRRTCDFPRIGIRIPAKPVKPIRLPRNR